ncbi:MAG: acyl-CoA thioesterase [Lachnospiraceae bacterium]|nr:acyl-CoA thioesterase [Lachnospiraceae bacterium]
MTKITPYQRNIHYYETDQMAIVHHSNYIRFLEECRMYYMEQWGIPYEKIEAAGILIPVLGVDVKYKQAIRFGDTIEISQRITRFSQVKFAVEYEIRNAKTQELHAIGSSEHAFVDSKLAPVRLKKDYPEIYTALSSCFDSGRAEPCM